MAQANKYALEKLLKLSTVELVLQDLETGETMATAEVDNHNIDITASTTPVRGGVHNSILYNLSSEKTLEVTVTDLVNRRDFEVAQNADAKGMQTRTVKIMQFPQTFELGALKTLTLENAPDNESDIIVYAQDGAVLAHTIEGKVVTVTEGKQNDMVTVAPYEYTTETAVESYDIAETNVTRKYKAVLRQPLFDFAQNIVFWEYTTIPMATFGTDSSKSGSTNKEAAKATYSLTAEKHPAYTYLAQVAYIPAK